MSYIKIQKIKKETVDQPEPGHIYLGYDDATVGGIGKGLWIKEDNATPAYYVLDGYSGAGPIINDNGLEPPNGYAGITQVLIHGYNFLSTSTVSFGGVACTIVQYNGPDKLLVTVPASVSPGNVSVVVHNSTFNSNPVNFTVLNVVNNAPFIESLNPDYGPVGQLVVIVGSNFDPNGTNTKVYFGAIEANIESISIEKISIRCPLVPVCDDTPVHVEVSNISSNTAYFDVKSDTSPTITSFNPTSGLPGATIDIYGTNFIPGVSVFFGPYGASLVSIINSGHLKATIPLSALAITNTYIQVGVSLPMYGFTILDTGLRAVPLIKDIFPTGQGSGQIVSVSGENLHYTPLNVWFGGEIAVKADTQFSLYVIDFILGENTPTGVVDVNAKNSEGDSLLPHYRYNGASNAGQPTLEYFWKTSYPPTPPFILPDPSLRGFGSVGDCIVLSGSNFVTGSGNAVGFGINADSFTPAINVYGQSPTCITCTIATGTQTGNVRVGVEVPDLIQNTSSYCTNAPFYVTPFSSPPNISKLSSTFGKAGDIVSISGANFTSDTTVGFGLNYPGTLAQISIIDDTYMTAIVPSGVAKAGDAILASIWISNSGGTSGVTYEIYETPIYPAVITSFSPSNGAVDTRLSIVGYNFAKYYTDVALVVYDSGSTKYYEMSLNSITFISSTLIFAELPSNPYAFIGITSLAVKTQANTGWNSKSGFTVT